MSKDSRKVEIPNQSTLLSNLNQVHKAGDLSASLTPKESVLIEKQKEENREVETSKTVVSTRRKKINQEEESYYKSTYLTKNEADSRKNVYINQELHKTISNIVSAVKIIDNKSITVGGYIDNVLAEHLEANREEINALYRIGKNDLVK